MYKRPGFSFVEAMTSVAIIGIIATITMFDLRSSQRTDELNNGIRVVASDLRSLQSRALSATNFKTCPAVGGLLRICEGGTAVCAVPAQCLPAPPMSVGVRFYTGGTTYDLFAEVESTKFDKLLTDGTEVFMQRNLALAGAPNVTVFALSDTNPSDVVFFRQNGNMQINACDPWVCPSPQNLTVTLRHTITGKTKTVYMETATGRISIQ